LMYCSRFGRSESWRPGATISTSPVGGDGGERAVEGGNTVSGLVILRDATAWISPAITGRPDVPDIDSDNCGRIIACCIPERAMPDDKVWERVIY